MRYEVDTHTHTIASGHAYSTMAEMAAAAKTAGLAALAITEHGPMLPGSCHRIYFHNYKSIDRHAFGIELLLGCEINIVSYDGAVDLDRKSLEKLDIGIASIHDHCYSIGTKAQNTRAYCRAMENPYVDIIGHPDDGRVPVDFEELVRCAKDTGKLLELNNSSLSPANPRENGYENMKTMLVCCERYGVMVSLGSDAHFFDRVGRFDDVQAILDEVHFPEELIANISVDRLKQHLHKFR